MDTYTHTKTLARHLMDVHGLKDWGLKMNNAKMTAGQCNCIKKEITLSKHLTTQEEAKIRNTILHEIAHALVGAEAGHGPIWQKKAREIGCDGKRCFTGAICKPKWLITCACKKTQISRHRVNQSILKSYACKHCMSGLIKVEQ